jgi:hypothetical protein
LATLEQQVARFLNDYLFTTVWNQPQREFRKVVIPTLLSSRSLHGTWDYGFGQVTLPDTQRNYFVYRIPMAQVSGIPLFPITTKYSSRYTEEWHTLSTIMDNDRLDVRVFGEHGEMFYRGDIHMIKHVSGEHLLLAIESKMALKIVSTPADMDNIKVDLYFDTDTIANMQTWHYKVTSDNLAEVWTNVTTLNTETVAAAKELVFVNGKLPVISDTTLTYKEQTDIKIGDYVECVDDGNVFCEFTVDPYAETTRSYMSGVRSQPAFIIHIPKALNPDYRMLTHNTCDVYAMPKDGSPGILIHRAYSNTRGFIQLTHADFAIPINVLTDYSSYFNQQFNIRVIVRHHDADNLMMRDVNYIDVLYLHNDQQIVDFMADDHNPMPFWKATVLEQSQYINFMFYYLRDFTENNITDIVEALGYFQTLSLICPQVYRSTITQDMHDDRLLSVPLPLLFSHKLTTIGHVFISGRKINDYLVTTISDGTNLNITFDASIELPVGAELVVELQEDDMHLMMRFTPTAEIPSVIIPITDYKVFEETRYTLPSGGPFIKGVDHTSNDSYRSVVPSETYTATTPITGTVMLTFPSHVYLTAGGSPSGRTFIIQNTIGIHRFDETSSSNMIGGTIQLPLEELADDDTTRPLLGDFAPVVYMNGKSLVEGVDFQLIKCGFVQDETSFYQIVIQNISYLKDGSFTTIQDNRNTFEIYLRRGMDVVTEFGHPTPGNPTGLNELFLWFPSLSMAYTNGDIISNAGIRHGLFTMESLPSVYGAISGARTSVTYYSNSVLSSLAADTDTEKIIALRAYLVEWLTADEPPIIEIPGSHKIYSIYVGRMVRELIDLYSATADDATINITDIKRTIINKYKYLKQYDVAYTQVLDRRFIDVYPWYRKLPVTNRRLYNMIQKLAQEVTELPDTITDGDLLQ